MTLAIVMFVSMIIGYAVAEVWYRMMIHRMESDRRINALKAEYLDKQLWQFISLDEWLNTQSKEWKPW